MSKIIWIVSKLLTIICCVACTSAIPLPTTTPIPTAVIPPFMSDFALSNSASSPYVLYFNVETLAFREGDETGEEVLRQVINTLQVHINDEIFTIGPLYTIDTMYPAVGFEIDISHLTPGIHTITAQAFTT